MIEQRRPRPARITVPGSETDPELMHRLERYALGQGGAQ